MSRLPLRSQSNTMAGGAATLGASLVEQPRSSATETVRPRAQRFMMSRALAPAAPPPPTRHSMDRPQATRAFPTPARNEYREAYRRRHHRPHGAPAPRAAPAAA